MERTIVGIASLATPTTPAPSLLALRVALGGTAILAAASGYVAGHAMDVSTTFHPEASLVMLLRFMAVMKLAAALGAVALTSWRIAAPIRLPFALAYTVASALMLAAPGLIWAMTTVVIGAVLFHAGLFIFVIAAWADRDTVVGAMRRPRHTL